MRADKFWQVYQSVVLLFRKLEKRGIATEISGCCPNCDSKEFEQNRNERHYAFVHSDYWEHLTLSEDLYPEVYVGFSDEGVVKAIQEIVAAPDEWLAACGITAEWNGDLGAKVKLTFPDFSMDEDQSIRLGEPRPGAAAN
jgi:hypothetical protein